MPFMTVPLEGVHGLADEVPENNGNLGDINSKCKEIADIIGKDVDLKKAADTGPLALHTALAGLRTCSLQELCALLPELPDSDGSKASLVDNVFQYIVGRSVEQILQDAAGVKAAYAAALRAAEANAVLTVRKPRGRHAHTATASKETPPVATPQVAKCKPLGRHAHTATASKETPPVATPQVANVSHGADVHPSRATQQHGTRGAGTRHVKDKGYDISKTVFSRLVLEMQRDLLGDSNIKWSCDAKDCLLLAGEHFLVHAFERMCAIAEHSKSWVSGAYRKRQTLLLRDVELWKKLFLEHAVNPKYLEERAQDRMRAEKREKRQKAKQQLEDAKSAKPSLKRLRLIQTV